MVWVPEIRDAADSGDDAGPAMFGRVGKPRFALSDTVADIARGSLACRMAASSWAGVCLGSVGAAALASMVPARTAAATTSAPPGRAQRSLLRISRCLIALPPRAAGRSPRAAGRSDRLP